VKSISFSALYLRMGCFVVLCQLLDALSNTKVAMVALNRRLGHGIAGWVAIRNGLIIIRAYMRAEQHYQWRMGAMTQSIEMIIKF